MCSLKILQDTKVKDYSVVSTSLTRDIHFVSGGDNKYQWTPLRILRKSVDYYQKHG